MKKMPLVMIMLLIFIVAIMGITDSWENPGDKGNHRDFISKYSSYVIKEPHDDKPAFPNDGELFLSDNIQKSEEMVEHLDKFIAEMKAEGNNVTELEPTVDNYSMLVSESRTYLEQAKNASSDTEKDEYIRLSKESIIHANSELKPIFDDVKAYLPGPLMLADNSNLVANGSGLAILSGDIDLELSISEGKLTILDFIGDMEINTEEFKGSEVKSEQVIVPESDAMQQILSYNDVQGNVTLSGSVLTVVIISNDLIIDVNGTGEVELYGKGTYMLSNRSTSNEGVWIPPIFDMKYQTKE
jgi:hypothetical protein